MKGEVRGSTIEERERKRELPGQVGTYVNDLAKRIFGPAGLRGRR